MTPSITIWTRLEPVAGVSDQPLPDGTQRDRFARALQAQIRDPLWMLARQWQTGEFRGDDGGSLIQATIETESAPLTSYRPAHATATPIDAVPLEAHVERESVELGVRAAAQLGLVFSQLLGHALASHLPAFLAAYPIAAVQPANELVDAESSRFRSIVSGKVVDGNALYAAALAQGSNLAQLDPIPSLGADKAAVADVVASFVEYRRGLYSEPSGDDAWVAPGLGYSFAAGSETAAGTVALEAPDFQGGRLDWYSFSLGSTAVGPAGTVAADRQEQTFLPTSVRFRGMPSNRFWQFEDNRTDFGSTTAENVDLAKLTVLEFALVAGDSWLQVPLPLDVGRLSRVSLLVVSDTFGTRTLIRSTSTVPMPSGARPWSMFTIAGPGGEGDFLLLPQTVAGVLDGPDLEDVVFVRDDNAGIGWAIETTLQGPLDAPVDGYASWRSRLADGQPGPTPAPSADVPVRYVAGTSVPDNWIPLVPTQTGPRSFLFQRGSMELPDASGALLDVPARGQILEPHTIPFYIHDEAIPRAGLEVTRRFRRARRSDGSTVVWLGRQVRVGRGEASSGLAFDLIEPNA